VVKLPLNDTVEKEDPNSFSNKIKEAIARYDEEQQRFEIEQQQEHHHQQQQQQATTPSPTQQQHQQHRQPAKPNSQLPYSDEDDDSSRSGSPQAIKDESAAKPQRAQSAPTFSFGASDKQPQQQQQQQQNKPAEPVTSGSGGAQPVPAKGGDQMLIEKDGVFTLMTKEEYTAMEKKREEEERRMNQSNGKNKPLVPHPPTKPKTSNNNERNASLKNRFITPKTNGEDNKNSSANTNNQNPAQITRVSRSADPNSRRDRQKRYFFSFA
jgi:hypothetical protein